MSTQTATILTRILDHKRLEVARNSQATPRDVLEERASMAPPVRDFAAALRKPGRVALIAEIKKASPSRGVLIEHFDPLALAETYMNNGASAISILTDEAFFQGDLGYLQDVRAAQLSVSRSTPLLRKDFLVDSYQVVEARAAGADAVLLIVAALDDRTLRALLELTHSYGMQALVEVHDVEELKRALDAGAGVVGVNNRDLHSFETTLTTTQRIAEQLAARATAGQRPVLVSESGIHTPDHVRQVREWGADAILVGEALVTSPNIGERVRMLAEAT